MSNFRVAMPNYMQPVWENLTKDRDFTRTDLQSFKDAAKATPGSEIEEALEANSIKTLTQQIEASPGGALHIDSSKLHPQSQTLGSALLEVSLLGDVQTAAVSNTGRSEQSLSQADMDFFMEYELKGMRGQKAGASELTRYKEVAGRYLASQAGKAPPSEADLQWANGIVRQVRAGQTPSTQDFDKFLSIKARQALFVKDNVFGKISEYASKMPRPTEPLTRTEHEQILSFMERVKSGYRPSEDELKNAALLSLKVQVQKESVDQKIKAYEDQLPTPTSAPTDAQCVWAADLYNKISSGYLPSQTEIQQFATVAKAKKAFR